MEAITSLDFAVITDFFQTRENEIPLKRKRNENAFCKKICLFHEVRNAQYISCNLFTGSVYRIILRVYKICL